jgi:hypothetical protein
MFLSDPDRMVSTAEASVRQSPGPYQGSPREIEFRRALDSYMAGYRERQAEVAGRRKPRSPRAGFLPNATEWFRGGSGAGWIKATEGGQ